MLMLPNADRALAEILGGTVDTRRLGALGGT
jgi:hypothetical protein